jgi:hypothetical protein
MAAALRYAIGIVGIAKGVSDGDADAAREAVAYARIFHASAKAAALRKFDGLPDLNAPLFNARVKAIFADALVLAGASGRAGGWTCVPGGSLAPSAPSLPSRALAHPNRARTLQ